ncbi:MAG: helix-turn-helix domain-containing protein [Synergistaceae bacterium]|jgi:hypothetical protein|nr:helix-turn-helix domain-containing protein [Synergistaceae bacterium]
MALTDIKEKASVVREERASSLKGFFNNCFVPPESFDKNAITRDMYSENAIYSENTTYSENDIHVGNAIYSENDTCSENDTRENTTYSENTTLENTTCSENTTRENTICSENDIRENDTYSKNTTLENATCSENTTRENATCSENATRNGNTVKLAKSLGFTALGALAVLMDEFPGGSGMLNVTQLSKSCGVARTTLIAQLRILEKCGVVSLGSAEKNGRWVEITRSENTTCSENATLAPCSSSCSNNILNNKNYYYYRGDDNYSENATHSENTTCSENDIYSENNILAENAMCLENNIRSENTTYSENDIYSENNTLSEKLSKSKITLLIASRELYFTAKASQTNIDRLSNQCFQQFLSVKHAKGANYAMALFLGLLSKSRENPTAYVIRAIQQGAAPSQEDQRRAEVISKAAETVFKKIGEEILQRDLDSALQQVSLGHLSQNQIQEELDLFAKRISE